MDGCSAIDKDEMPIVDNEDSSRPASASSSLSDTQDTDTDSTMPSSPSSSSTELATAVPPNASASAESDLSVSSSASLIFTDNPDGFPIYRYCAHLDREEAPAPAMENEDPQPAEPEPERGTAEAIADQLASMTGIQPMTLCWIFISILVAILIPILWKLWTAY